MSMRQDAEGRIGVDRMTWCTREVGLSIEVAAATGLLGDRQPIRALGIVLPSLIFRRRRHSKARRSLPPGHIHRDMSSAATCPNEQVAIHPILAHRRASKLSTVTTIPPSVGGARDVYLRGGTMALYLLSPRRICGQDHRLHASFVFDGDVSQPFDFHVRQCHPFQNGKGGHVWLSLRQVGIGFTDAYVYRWIVYILLEVT